LLLLLEEVIVDLVSDTVIAFYDIFGKLPLSEGIKEVIVNCGTYEVSDRLAAVVDYVLFDVVDRYPPFRSTALEGEDDLTGLASRRVEHRGEDVGSVGGLIEHRRGAGVEMDGGAKAHLGERKLSRLGRGCFLVAHFVSYGKRTLKLVCGYKYGTDVCQYE
jgi:hypothetical protein